MSALPPAALALLALTALGLPLGGPLLPHVIVRRLGWSFLAGVALWGLVLFAASHWLRLPLREEILRPLLALLAATGVAVEAARQRRAFSARETSATPAATPASRLARRRVVPACVGLVACLVLVGVIAGATLEPVRDVDGRVTWTAHMRYLRHAGSVDAPVLRAERALVAHPRYPPLLPLLQLTMADAAGGDERGMKLLFAAFWASLVALLWDGGERFGGERTAAALALLACGLRFPAYFSDGGAAGAYSDLPLACLAGGAAVLLLDPRERRTALAAVLLAATALTKNEGAVLALAIVAGAVVAGWPLRASDVLRRLALPLASLLLALALLASWRTAIPNRYDEAYGSAIGTSQLLHGLSRLPAILRLAAAATVDREKWLLAWPLLVVLALYGAVVAPARRRLLLAFSTTVGIALGGYMVAYLVTSWSIAELVPVTWNRFLEQLLVPCGLLAAPGIAVLLDDPCRPLLEVA